MDFPEDLHINCIDLEKVILKRLNLYLCVDCMCWPAVCAEDLRSGIIRL